ncbi:MAG TPA: hypothetical protein VMJ10_11850 [Kofleriaceae bacterium]|nr:hypothetical protein [Kofleriaceae bacterium]
MTTIRFCTAATAIAFGCTTRTPPSDPAGGDDSPTASADGADHVPVVDPTKPVPPTSCPVLGTPGSVIAQYAITGGDIVAVGPDGNTVYTADEGIVKITPKGTTVYSFPFGSVFALDDAGNAFVAGSFTAPIDFGGGVTLSPMGNVDVFVAKLTPSGKLVFAIDLGLCGAGLEAIAVAHDGRIAVSGESMGTAVLDASGKLLFDLSYDGQLAFDSIGDLYIAGSFVGSIDFGGGHVLNAASATDTDGFLVRVDCGGAFVSSVQFGDAPLPVLDFPDAPITTPRPQTIAAIAINANDRVAVLGTFQDEMLLFGDTLVLPSGLPSGIGLGTFAAELEGGNTPVFGRLIDQHYSYNPPGAIAIDGDDNVIASTNHTSEAFFPFAIPTLYKLEPTKGATIWSYPLGELRGYGLGVATTACGDVVWADTEHSSVLIPLQPTLRLIAR